MDPRFQALRQGFTQARTSARARHRDIAQSLGLSEGELVAAHAGLFDPAESPLAAQRLRGSEWPQVIAGLEAVGEVLALTRNEACVHEKTGVYRNTSVNNHVGLVLAGAIDLRVFYSQWAHGFAVQERLPDGHTQRSLQFFDLQGTAIHKVFLREASDVFAYDELVARFALADRTPGIEVWPADEDEPPRPDSEVDVQGFRDAWAAMQDTHEFFGLLRRFEVTRTQGLRLAPPEFAQRMPAASAREALQRASRQAVPVMVFVGNPGMIQIHSGPVQRIEVMGPWLNVLDPGFNLHLREDHVASAWLVRKPTSDGLVHSLELFDARGRTIAMFFGERKPGKPEREDWRDLLDQLAREGEPCEA
jgi:putative hemin transport protein